MSAEFWISVDIYRNTWNRLEWLEIFSKVRVGYYSGLFYRHGIFRPLRPERNGINNIESNLIT